jgi:hypothetical protein
MFNRRSVLLLGRCARRCIISNGQGSTGVVWVVQNDWVQKCFRFQVYSDLVMYA